MAVYQANSKSIPYRMDLGPFHFDLVLLQGSQKPLDLWLPLLDDLAKSPYGGGRILTFEWPGLTGEELVKFMQTLALVSVRVVALDDAVEVVNDAQKLSPRLFERTLFFPEGGPKGEALIRAARDLCRF